MRYKRPETACVEQQQCANFQKTNQEKVSTVRTGDVLLVGKICRVVVVVMFDWLERCGHCVLLVRYGENCLCSNS